MRVCVALRIAALVLLSATSFAQGSLERLTSDDPSQREAERKLIGTPSGIAIEEIGAEWRRLARGFCRANAVRMLRLLSALEALDERALLVLSDLQAGMCDLRGAPWKNDWDLWHDRALVQRDRMIVRLRERLGEWIGSQGRPAVVPYFRSFLEAPCSLGAPTLKPFRLRRSERIPILLDLYQVPDPRMRDWVRECAGELSLADYRALMRRLRDDQGDALIATLDLVAQLPKRGEELTQAVAVHLGHEDARIRISATRALGELVPESLNVLLGALGNADSAVQVRAAEQVWRSLRFDEARSVLLNEGLDALVRALESEQLDVRVLAIRTLHDLVREHDAIVIPPNDHVRGAYDPVGATTIWTLRGVRSELVARRSAIERAARDDSPLVRFWAGHALRDLDHGRWIRLRVLAEQEDVIRSVEPERLKWTRSQLETELRAAARLEPLLDPCVWPKGERDYRWEAALSLVHGHLDELIAESDTELLEELDRAFDDRLRFLASFADCCRKRYDIRGSVLRELRRLGVESNGRGARDEQYLGGLRRGWLARPGAAPIIALDERFGFHRAAAQRLKLRGDDALSALPFVVAVWRHSESVWRRSNSLDLDALHELVVAMGESARERLESLVTDESMRVRGEAERALIALQR